jgi:hypothetical protein
LSAAVPRRHAAITPVTTPKTIAKKVPSATIRDGVLDRLPEHGPHGLLRPQRTSHVPLREVAEVDLVLLPLRLVEPECLPLVVLEVLRAASAAKRGDRVARERAEEDEVQGDRDEDGPDREQHPLDDVVRVAHVVVSRVPLAAASATSAQRPFLGLV